MNPQYEEHLRDSAPDNSRFDGFDRGDLGHGDEPYLEEALRKPRGPSLAIRLLAAIGAFSGLREMPAMSGASAWLPAVSSAKASNLRKSRRALTKAVGRRQARRLRCKGYALKRAALAAT